MSWLFPYVGGKTYLVPEIIKYMPTHKCLVEVFGGSAALLLSRDRRRSEVEVYNDLDKDITTFLMMLRQAGEYKPILDRLIWLCRNTPYSRKVYETWLHEWKVGIRPMEPVEYAAVWYFLAVCATNMFGGGWSHSCQKNEADEWQSHVNLLPEIADRLLHIQIECQDFTYILEKYDGPETFWYCDPPYIGVPGVNEYYNEAPPMTEERHVELAKLLNNIKGKAIVSYYPHPLVDQMYPKPKWRWMSFERSKLSQSTVKGSVKDKGTELLIFNYEPMPLFTFGEREDNGAIAALSE